MAGFREHISVSGLLGVSYGMAAWSSGFTPVQSTLAAGFTWIAGMLPDLDSDTGRPIRELFGLTAAAGACLVMRSVITAEGDTEQALLSGFFVYAVIRYVGPLLLSSLCVHRGMFHSIPALLIAVQFTILGYHSPNLMVRLLMAGGVGIGFLSHLVLDELYSVEWTGIRLKLNAAAGSALKFFGKSFVPNAIAWMLLLGVTYANLLSLGVIEQPDKSPTQSIHPAAEPTPEASANRRRL